LGMTFSETEGEGNALTDEQAAAIREILSRHEELDAGLQAATACEGYASLADFQNGPDQLIDSLMPVIQRYRSAARFLAWQTYLRRYDDRPDDAVRRGIDLLRLSMLAQKEPTLVSYLV